MDVVVVPASLPTSRRSVYWSPRERRAWFSHKSQAQAGNVWRSHDCGRSYDRWRGLALDHHRQYPPTHMFVIDPLGWNTVGTLLQKNIGNNGTGAPDPNSLPRFNGELSTPGEAVLGAMLPDSWIEQARGPVTAFTGNSVTITGVDYLSAFLLVAFFNTPGTPAVAFPTPVTCRAGGDAWLQQLRSQSHIKC